MSNSPVDALEKARRDFKRTSPDLYRYVSLVEQAKAMDDAFSAASNVGAYAAANKISELHARFLASARRMRTAPPAPDAVGGA